MLLTLIDFPDFLSSGVWLSLLTLVFLEMVLGVINMILISMAAGKSPCEEQAKATNIGLILSVIIRMFFAVQVGRFVRNHRTIQMLGLSFLILIGFMLILNGGQLAGLSFFDSHIGGDAKGYLYFAVVFALLVEFLNLKIWKKSVPVPLYKITEA